MATVAWQRHDTMGSRWDECPWALDMSSGWPFPVISRMNYNGFSMVKGTFFVEDMITWNLIPMDSFQLRNISKSTFILIWTGSKFLKIMRQIAEHYLVYKWNDTWRLRAKERIWTWTWGCTLLLFLIHSRFIVNEIVLVPVHGFYLFSLSQKRLEKPLNVP